MSDATEGQWGTLLRALLVRSLVLLPLPFLNSIVTRDTDIYCFTVKEIKTGSDLEEILQRNQKDCLALACVCRFKGLSKVKGTLGENWGKPVQFSSFFWAMQWVVLDTNLELLRAKEACTLWCFRSGNPPHLLISPHHRRIKACP